MPYFEKVFATIRALEKNRPVIMVLDAPGGIKIGKPVMLTKFGADIVAGMYALPAQMFSEEYQEV